MSNVEKYITNNFQFLSGNLSPEEGLAKLQDNCYGVIQDVQGRPIALVIPEDLQKAASERVPSLLQAKAIVPPTIVVGCAVKMQDFANSKAKRVLLRKPNARGAVVLNDEGVIGVLPVQAFRDYLRTEYQLLGGELGLSANITDTELAGSLKQTTWMEICTECWYVNEFNEKQWTKLKRIVQNPDSQVRQQLPNCQNPDEPPHPLKLDLD